MSGSEQEIIELKKTCGDQLIFLVQDATDNIRLAKRQQWNVGYYTILLYAALVLIAEHVPNAILALPSYKVALAVSGALLAAVAACGGVFVMWNLQRWMTKYRIRIVKAEKKFCKEYNEIVECDRAPNYTGIQHAPAVLWLLTTILVLGFVVTMVIIIIEFQ
jgi:hypothetical protein